VYLYLAATSILSGHKTDPRGWPINGGSTRSSPSVREMAFLLARDRFGQVHMHFVKHDARQLIIKIIFSSTDASAFVSVTISKHKKSQIEL
jgi:hypothetical protein